MPKSDWTKEELIDSARWLVDGKLMFDERKCFGCGLCLSTCLNDAISLVEGY